MTQDFTLTPGEVDQLLAEGVQNARGLASFRFFTNAVATTTQGLDIVSTYVPPAFGGDTVFSAVFNHTTTEVTHFDPKLLNVARRIRELQEALPKNRWNVRVTQRAGALDLLGRISYYGAWFDWDSAQTLFSGKPVVDVELGIPLSDDTTLAFGSQNVFNTFPTRVQMREASASGTASTRRGASTARTTTLVSDTPGSNSVREWGPVADSRLAATAGGKWNRWKFIWGIINVTPSPLLSYEFAPLW